MPSPTKMLKILFVSAESAPSASAGGGPANVISGLPRALKALGHDVRVVMPYSSEARETIGERINDHLGPFSVPIREGVSETARILKSSLSSMPNPGRRAGDLRLDTRGDVPVYLVQNDRWVNDEAQSQENCSSDPDPVLFFNRAVMEMVPRLRPRWQPDIVHCHDWQAGLVPVYLRTLYRAAPDWSFTTPIFTVHDLAQTGEFDRDVLAQAGLPAHLFTYDQLEFYGRVSLLKGGLMFSDHVTTVSERYAREIQTQEHGSGFDGLFRYLAGQRRLCGIVNGIDTTLFDPAAEEQIPARYNDSIPSPKTICKSALQAECGLTVDPNVAIVGIVSRLVEHKGFDLVRESIDEMLSLPIQIIVLGAGDPGYETLFRDLHCAHPDKIHARTDFDRGFARRIYAGSDMFLMPSRLEPCGAEQLIALRYGAIPIVRATGGLADTIENYKPSVRGERSRGNGFVFDEYNSSSLMSTLRRAVETFENRAQWAVLVHRALSADFSWSQPARRYAALYYKALRASLAGIAA